MLSTRTGLCIPTRRAILAIAALVPLAGCSRGESIPPGSSPSQPVRETAPVRILLADAVVENLQSFELDVLGIRLEGAGGATTEDLLPVPVRVELLGLDETFRWLANGDVPVGTYTSLVIEIDPLTVTARALDGSRPVVSTLTNLMVLPLQPEVDLIEGHLATFAVDVDLLASVTGSISSGMLDFDPRGLAGLLPANATHPIAKIDGLVMFRDTGTLDLVVEGFANDERTVSLGPVPILVDLGTLLVNRDDQIFFQPPLFFTILFPNLTFIEIHGALAPSGFVADRIEIEDQDGGAGDTFPVVLAGRVELTSAGVRTMRVREVKKGAEFAFPILAGLGDPIAVSVSFSTNKMRVFEGNSVVLPFDEAEPGQLIEVKFRNFSAEPFPAARVSLEEPFPRYIGPIVEVSGVPAEFEMRLRPDEPAIAAGLVDPATDTRVDLTTSTAVPLIVLGIPSRPALAPSDLVVGLDTVVSGVLSGDPDRPVITGFRTRVPPGLLDGAEVVGSDRLSRTFTTVGGDVRGSFGAGVSPGPFVVRVEPGAVVRGDATSASELFELLEGPILIGQRIMVSVQGIGTSLSPDILRAYQLEVRVVGP